MKRVIRTIVTLLMTTIFLSSCFEIIEEIDLKADGSGVVKYIVNLSQSKLKISPILKLDSIQGHKVPNEEELHNKLSKLTSYFKEQTGISKSHYQLDFDHYIVEFSIYFAQIKYLNAALLNLPYWEKSEWKPSEDFFLHESNKLVKQIEFNDSTLPQDQIEKHKEDLAAGTFTSIIRTKQEILSGDGSNFKRSGNGKAAMIKTNLLKVIHQPNILSYSIQFK